MYAVSKMLIQQQVYYVTVNGDELIPSVALDAVFSYEKYFYHNQDKNRTRVLIMTKKIF